MPEPARSLGELLAGATARRAFESPDARSGAPMEHVTIRGRPHVVKLLHVDSDWIQRGAGDLRCYVVELWRSGLLDALPDCIDPTVAGVATGIGRNGWGAAVLMRDVSRWLVPPGDDPVPIEQHRRFLDHMAALAAAFWGWSDDEGRLLPYAHRWLWFNDAMLDVERGRGWPDRVPPLAADGWTRFARRAPGDVAGVVGDLRCDPGPLVAALRRTPSTFLHGDWKMGNLGSHEDGRTILIDWSNPGEGPACHDLAWYLALNQARVPERKDDAVDAFGAALRGHGVDTAGWFDAQMGLALLGALVIFGWEKALGADEELGWWCDRARDGAKWL